MQGDERVIEAKMCQNWGYLKLGKKHYEESLGEMKHAEKLIDRILFLEGLPDIARYDVIRVGADVKEQFENDLKLEMGGVKHYNETITARASCSSRSSRNPRSMWTGSRRNSTSSSRLGSRTTYPSNWVRKRRRIRRSSARATP